MSSPHHYIMSPNQKVHHAETLITQYGATITSPNEVGGFDDIADGKVLVCSFHNANFDATMIVHDQHDIDICNDPTDTRLHVWLLVDRLPLSADFPLADLLPPSQGGTAY